MARDLQNWIKTYMEYTAPMEAPDTFHFWAAVSTIAGALRRCVWMDMGHFQWTPNFYIIFVAPPGIVSKSTTLSIGMSMLREVKDVKFGPDVITWQALTQALAGSRLDVPIDGAFLAMSAITIFSSELGAFLNPHDREMIDVLVDLWDNRSGAWEKVTKTSGNDQVVNPWLNIAACTTPSWISGNFPEYMIGGGFTSRCVFVFSDKKRRLVAYPFLEMPVAKFREQRVSLVKDLQEISLMRGEFKLSQSALDFGIQWYADHYNKINKELNNAQFAGYLARKQTHVHKLAMVLAAAENNSRIIQLHNLQHATAIITGLEADMPKVFSGMGGNGDAKYTSILLDIIKSYGKVDKRTLFRICAAKMTTLEFSNAIDACLATGYVQSFSNGVGVFYVFTEDKPVAPASQEGADSSGASSSEP